MPQYYEPISLVIFKYNLKCFPDKYKSNWVLVDTANHGNMITNSINIGKVNGISLIIYSLIQQQNKQHTIKVAKNVTDYFETIGDNYYDSTTLDRRKIPVCKGKYKINRNTINVIHVVGPDLTNTSRYKKITQLIKSIINASTDKEYSDNYYLLYKIFYTLYEKIINEAQQIYAKLPPQQKSDFRLILPIISSGIFAYNDKYRYWICRIFINVYRNIVSYNISEQLDFYTKLRIINYDNDIIEELLNIIIPNTIFQEEIKLNFSTVDCTKDKNETDADFLHNFKVKII